MTILELLAVHLMIFLTLFRLIEHFTLFWFAVAYQFENIWIDQFLDASQPRRKRADQREPGPL